MDDLISRQAAIDALWKALYEYEDKTEKQFQESDELDVADWIGHRIFVQNMSDIDRQTILALPSAQPLVLHCTDCEDWHTKQGVWGISVSELPSAQPERTNKCTETHACDSISRQAAVDELIAMREHIDAGMSIVGHTAYDMAIEALRQPEIIRCKDCRWWDKYGDYDNGYCMAAKHGYWSEHWDISIRRTYKGDFYCADAEPKGEQE